MKLLNPMFSNVKRNYQCLKINCTWILNCSKMIWICFNRWIKRINQLIVYVVHRYLRSTFCSFFFLGGGTRKLSSKTMTCIFQDVCQCRGERVHLVWGRRSTGWRFPSSQERTVLLWHWFRLKRTKKCLVTPFFSE